MDCEDCKTGQGDCSQAPTTPTPPVSFYKDHPAKSFWSPSSSLLSACSPWMEEPRWPLWRPQAALAHHLKTLPSDPGTAFPHLVYQSQSFTSLDTTTITDRHIHHYHNIHLESLQQSLDHVDHHPDVNTLCWTWPSFSVESGRHHQNVFIWKKILNVKYGFPLPL